MFMCVFVRVGMKRQKGREENSLWNDDPFGKMLRIFCWLFFMAAGVTSDSVSFFPPDFVIVTFFLSPKDPGALKCIIKTLKPVLFCILNGILNWEIKSFPAEWPWNNAQGIRLLKINKYLLHNLVWVHVCVWPSVASGYRYTTLQLKTRNLAAHFQTNTFLLKGKGFCKL